jgi:hypothetical protein
VTPRRVTGRGRGAGWTDLRHERERETNGSGKEKNERDERNGGKRNQGVFVVHPEIQIFFFFLGDVEGATSAQDGRWMDAGWTLRITPFLYDFNFIRSIYKYRKKKIQIPSVRLLGATAQCAQCTNSQEQNYDKPSTLPIRCHAAKKSWFVSL